MPSLIDGVRGKVLDLGPGPGNQMDRFTPSQIDYIYGIEPNANFGAQLAKKLSGHALEDKYKVLVCGIEDSDILRGEGITENSMDTILSIQVMCAVNDPRAVMKEIWKLLKPGGRFIFWEHGKNKDFITAATQGTSIAAPYLSELLPHSSRIRLSSRICNTIHFCCRRKSLT